MAAVQWVHEPPRFPLRRQTVADLTAARWNLHAWEEPRLTGPASPFWADVAMRRGRVLDTGDGGEEALFRVVLRSRATFTGLRRRDGGLIIRVERGRRADQFRVSDGDAFAPDAGRA